MLNNAPSFNKYNIISSITNSDKNDRLFNQLDALLVQKRFELAAELSLTENVLHISTYKLTNKNILKIVTDFIKSAKQPNLYEKRNLFELVKLSNLPKDKLDKTISKEQHLELTKLLCIVSHETMFIGCDFLILKIADNFALKCNDVVVKEAYFLLQKDVMVKIVYHPYGKEKEEKETTLLCWVDRILSAVIREEISPDEFISVAKKIIKTTQLNISVLWKLSHAVKYLLLQSEFSTCSVLKDFKNYISSSIIKQYEHTDLTLEDVQNLVATTLAKRTPVKEDFYNLFDTLKFMAKKDEDSRFFCLLLCKYIIKHTSKQNIFCFRFVRSRFLNTLFDIIHKPNENIKTKEEELEILISLFHIDSFYSFYAPDILGKIIEILQTINNGKIKLNNKNFYKYCDVLDYIMSKNKELQNQDIVKILSFKDEDETKIKRYFTLSSAT